MNNTSSGGLKSTSGGVTGRAAVFEMGCTWIPDASLTAVVVRLRKVLEREVPSPSIINIPSKSALLRTTATVLVKPDGTALLVREYELPELSEVFCNIRPLKSIDEVLTGSLK